MSGLEPQPPLAYPAGPRPGKGFAVAGMVLGIVSLVVFCFPYLSIPCAILGIIFGAVGRGRAAQAGGGGMAMAGIVCGVITIVLVALFIAGCLAFFGLNGSELLKHVQQMEQLQRVRPPQ